VSTFYFLSIPFFSADSAFDASFPFHPQTRWISASPPLFLDVFMFGRPPKLVPLREMSEFPAHALFVFLLPLSSQKCGSETLFIERLFIFHCQSPPGGTFSFLLPPASLVSFPFHVFSKALTPLPTEFRSDLPRSPHPIFKAP